MSRVDKSGLKWTGNTHYSLLITHYFLPVNSFKFYTPQTMNSLYVEQLGQSNSPLLLLHGWGRNSSDLKPMAELLAAHSQVHLMDLPGFGNSEPPQEVWDSFQYAQRLISYLDEKKIDKIDLIGHSFGGKVALSFAARYPDRVRKLVLLATSGLKRKRTINEYFRFIGIRGLGQSLKLIDKMCGTALFKNKFASRFGSSDYKNAKGVMRSILVKSVNEDITSHLSLIKAPTLILWGACDSETPVEMAYRLKKHIINSKVIVFPLKNHHLYHDSGGHLCSYYIESFLGLKGEHTRDFP